MIKSFSAGDISVRPFQTYKNWNIQSVVSGAYDSNRYPTYYSNLVEIDEGIKYQHSFSIDEPTSSYGRYKRVIYNVTDAMFYRYKDNPAEIFGLEIPGCDPFTGRKEIRDINGRITTFRIATSYWGEKVRPKSVHIVDNSNLHQTYEIYDDGYTNLYATGSHFNSQQIIPAVKSYPPPFYWNTGSGYFVYTYPNGDQEILNTQTAKEYMGMGLQVEYFPDSGSWDYDESGSIDIFEPSGEHFGESVSVWDRYVAVGSPMDSFSLSSSLHGYAALFKYDTNLDRHRLVRRFHSPHSYEGIFDEYGPNMDTVNSVTSSGFMNNLIDDGYGTSISVDNGFLAVGAPKDAATGSVQSGCVHVYDKYKGGIENWGIINTLPGDSVGDKFGQSVSLDKDILAIGAPNVSGSKGAVYIYRRYRYENSGSCDYVSTSSLASLYSPQGVPTYISGNFTWIREAVLTSSILQTGDRFGWCLQANNDRVIVGTYMTGSDGYAALFTCSYYSASINDCPTASWSENKIFYGDETFGDIPISSPEYVNEISMSYDGFGMAVSLNGDHLLIGSYFDKGFTPYNGAPTNLQKVLGAAYFYQYLTDPECGDAFRLIKKTFGNTEFENVRNFARSVSIDGLNAAISYETDDLVKYVWYDSGSGLFTLESSSYQSSGSEDSVLGRVAIYSYDSGDITWEQDTILRRNKEENKPFNVFGKSVYLNSGFLAVGAPIYNYADPVSQSLIIDAYVQSASAFPYNYSGSVFVYDFDDYNKNPHLGNMFYRNGYAVMTNTSSNFYDILTNTGSRGFDMKYQGTHTIFEHEYLVTINPGEFNYSTNPTALIQDTLLFDVNQDGVFDLYDVNYIMQYLTKKRFQDESRYYDNGIGLETNSPNDYDWWGMDLLQTEGEDVLLLESEITEFFASSSFTLYTKKIFDYIENNLVKTGILDIDGNGKIDLKDGAILVAYYANKLTPTLLPKYLDENSTRRYVKDIISYLDRYCGKKLFNVDPNFFNYQLSSSYDRTGSYLAPYITTIGLYDETSGSLVAVAKLGKPIKNLIDWPINIIVRFDT
jgi:hypothetical protein